jgi:hypothetical protein
LAFNFFPDRIHRVLYTRIVGVPRSRELVGYYRAMIRKGYIQAGWRELLDGREIALVEVDLGGQEQLALLAEENRDRLREMKSALVAPNEAVYGIFRQYQLMVQDYQEDLMVYRRMDEALEYLDIPADEAEANLNRVAPFSP